MRSWDTTVSEAIELYSPIGLRLLDDLTQRQPIGDTSAILEFRDASGAWGRTDIRAVRTPSGVICYPGLGRSANVNVPARRYRVRITAEFYIPFYRRFFDGIEFDAFPYNDENPLQVVVALAQDEPLTPAPNYPFEEHIPVLRGLVVDNRNRAVADAEVSRGGGLERVVTDSHGSFALPLRLEQENVPIPIDASDHRTGRVGFINIQLPQDLGASHTIAIN